MRFAHLADTHLGYRQYNLDEREEDFYSAFSEAVDKIIAEKCDFVIHSGDLFDEARPHIRAMLEVRKALDKLDEAGIRVFAVTGNHDRIIRKGAFPPHSLYKRMELFTLEKPYSEFGNILLCGMPYIPKSYGNVLKDKLEELAQKAKDYEKKILVLHQGIDKYIGFETAYELKIGDVPRGFDYYAMGHVHLRRIDELDGGKLVYPGSTEIWRVDELKDYEKNGKGFYIVDTDNFDIERIDLECIRPFISEEVGEEDIGRIREAIKGDKKPILRLNVTASATDYPLVYQNLLDEFQELVLQMDIKRKPEEEEEVISGKAVSIREMLEEALVDCTEGEVGYAQELLEALSNRDIEEARDLTEKFYKGWIFREMEAGEGENVEPIEEKEMVDSESRLTAGQRKLGAFR